MAKSSKQVVLITGGAMGQGRTHAVAFAKAGFDVVLIDMLEPENEIFKETIALVRDAGGEVLALQANICSTPEVEAAFAQGMGKVWSLGCGGGQCGYHQFWLHLGIER